MKFVFSPALFPKTPLEGETVFLHGTILEIKKRNREYLLRGSDEKGTWETYTENDPKIEVGMRTRAYGKIVAQPDGKIMLAAKWVKMIEQNELEFCKRKTSKEWNQIVAQYPTLQQLQPFEGPKPVVKTIVIEAKNEQKPANDPDFVSAQQLHVEREYL